MRHYLLDASALADYVLNTPDLKAQRVRRAVTKVAALREAGRAEIYVPSVCIAECSKAIARTVYADGWCEEADDAHLRYSDALWENVSPARGGRMRVLEIRREHLQDSEDIFRREYRTPVRDRRSRLSGVDAVVIAMGRELARRYGDDRTVIVTAECWMAEVCSRNRECLPAAVYAVERPIPDAA